MAWCSESKGNIVITRDILDGSHRFYFNHKHHHLLHLNLKVLREIIFHHASTCMGSERLCPEKTENPLTRI